MNNQNKDSVALGKIFDTLQQRESAKGYAFGETMNGLSKEAKNDLVDNMSKIIFGTDIRRANGESGISTGAGINADYRKNLLAGLSEEFIQRGKMALSAAGENFAGVASQQWQVYGSNTLNSNQQLLLMALCPAVIKPIHNKIAKSIVTKDIEFKRAGLMPVLFSEDGEQFNFFEILNSVDAIAELQSGGQPLISVEVPMSKGDIDKPDVNGNLCDIYNRSQQAKDSNFKAIKSIHDFIATGVRITSVSLHDDAEPADREAKKIKSLPVTYQSTGSLVQSGQFSKMVAPITLRLTDPDGKNKNINIMGRIDADGTVILRTDSKRVMGVTFEFIIPAKGAESPVKIYDVETTFIHPIQMKATASTTLNNQLIDDVQLKLNKDIVTRFNEASVEFVNSKKDAQLLRYIDKQLSDMKSYSEKKSKFINEETLQSLKAVYAYQLADMSVANPGYTDFMTGANMILAKAMFEVANSIDVELNPAEKNFSVYSSSSAAQWIKDASGQNPTKLNIVGESTNDGGTIGGITTPYDLQNIRIGNLYTGTYIVSNKVKSADTNKVVANIGGGKENANARKHKYVFIPKFEEKMDSILFLHGLERVTEGVNDSEYIKDKTLNYDTRYDITSYNKSIGAVEFIEAPVASIFAGKDVNARR